MTEPKRISAFWIGFLMVIVLVIAFDVHAQAHDNCNGQSCNDAGILSGGDNVATNAASIGGSRALALGGSDMDIRGGYRSYSYLFGLIQETKSNPLEVARQLQAEGNYEAAAYLRCQPWGIYKAYGGKEKCIEMMSRPTETFVEPVMAEPDNDDDDRLDELYARMADYEDSTELARQAAGRANAAAVRANQAEIERKAKAEQAYLDYQEQFIEQD